jgi:rod shape determining protein RodA
MYWWRTFARFDFLSLFVILCLGGTSLTLLSSLSQGLPNGVITRQGIAWGIGMLLYFALGYINYRHLVNRFSTLGYLLTLSLLSLVLIFGSTIRGTTGWLVFDGLQFQPVEIVKPIFLFFIASFHAKQLGLHSGVARLFYSALLTFPVLLLVLMQPDFGSGLMLLVIWGGVLVAAGQTRRVWVVLSILAVAAAVAAWFFLAPYQKERLLAFANPTADTLGSGYNVRQALVAVGAGGLLGAGYGQGSQSQLQFLPEKHTDFIYASLVEEMGLLGGAWILFLLLFLLCRMLWIAYQASDNAGYMYVIGATALLLVQITINVGMNMGIVPVTGLPLPLVSYGGSAIIGTLMLLGVVQSVYRYRRV